VDLLAGPYDMVALVGAPDMIAASNLIRAGIGGTESVTPTVTCFSRAAA